MLLHEFGSRLDEHFHVRRFAEFHGWDFALSEVERESLLSRGSATFQATFNGLVLADGADGRAVDRVYLLVFPEESLVAQVIEQERGRDCPGAVILTHHPCDMETSGRGFLAIEEETLVKLRQTNVAIYVLHAPLDCHAEISTSGAVADGLGLRRVGTFAPYVDGHAGVIGEQAAEPFGDFAERVRRLCELTAFRPDQVRFAERPVERVAVIAGGGDSVEEIDEADRLGADTYLAGHWWTPHAGAWPDANRAALGNALPRWRMNFLSASHDGSELVVFRDRLTPLVEGWGIETVLMRQENHWR